MKTSGVLALIVLVLVAGGATLTMNGCASTVPNVDPIGSLLPTVKGQALDGTPRTLPADLAGSPAVLLVGYVQGTQFDIDRWVVGLLQTKTPARIYEIPTLDGLVPTVISGWIDSGMRSGIPAGDWPSVVTVYGAEAARIVAATGNEKPRNARVLLLDTRGRIVWFHDRGFSPSQLLALDAAARSSAPR